MAFSAIASVGQFRCGQICDVDQEPRLTPGSEPVPADNGEATSQSLRFYRNDGKRPTELHRFDNQEHSVSEAAGRVRNSPLLVGEP